MLPASIFVAALILLSLPLSLPFSFAVIFAVISLLRAATPLFRYIPLFAATLPLFSAATTVLRYYAYAIIFAATRFHALIERNDADAA